MLLWQQQLQGKLSKLEAMKKAKEGLEVRLKGLNEDIKIQERSVLQDMQKATSDNPILYGETEYWSHNGLQSRPYYGSVIPLEPEPEPVPVGPPEEKDASASKQEVKPIPEPEPDDEEAQARARQRGVPANQG